MGTWNVVVSDFDHPHARFTTQYVSEHPETVLVGICDEDPSTSLVGMEEVAERHAIDRARCFGDLDHCLQRVEPDIVFGCPNTGHHAPWVERVAPYETHVIVEKPFAHRLEAADRMIDALTERGNRLGIHWPLAFAPEIQKAKRLLDDDRIGEIVDLEYVGGNRGPERSSWFYDTDAGGGSLLDFLGYGVTLDCWFRGGEVPDSITCESSAHATHAVDDRSVSIARYGERVSVYQTSWRLFTNPWEHRTEPPTGFSIVGTSGTLSTRLGESGVFLQTTDDPEGCVLRIDPTDGPASNIVDYVVDRLDRSKPFEGPTAPSMSRCGQRMTDAARLSAEAQRRVALAEVP